MIEQWLRSIRKSSQNKLVRTVATVFLVLFVLAVIVTLASDLGFAAEISQYRTRILIGLLLLAVVISVGLIVKELTNNNEFLTKRVRELNSKIDEKTVNEKSLLKLMEAHKRNAYTEILRYLERLTILISMRHEWENNGARLVKMLIKPYSTAEQLDPEYAKRERIDCVVNVGSVHEVCEGMEFIVQDTAIDYSYGIIFVRKVDPKGATCSLTEINDEGFWAEALGLSEQGKAGIVEAHDNKIVPNLPPDLEEVTEETAEEFRAMIRKISSTENEGS